MRDIKPLLLLLLSVGLVATWSYHLYDKTRYSQRRTEVLVKDSAAVADAIRDSLNRIFSSTIHELDQQLLVSDSSLLHTRHRADSLQNSLENRMKEISRLRTEINTILGKGRQASSGDIATARKKIEELQGQVRQLETQKDGMQAEQVQLTRTLERLTQNAGTLEQNIKQLSEENALLNQKIQLASVFVASNVRLMAVGNRGARETSSARKAHRLVASFSLQNKVQDFSNAEIAIVIVQPDRQVLQSSAWDSGEMQTTTGSRKFSRYVKFDYTRDEEKSLTFSLDVPDFQKGTYVMELWHKGHLIGKATTTLK